MCTNVFFKKSSDLTFFSGAVTRGSCFHRQPPTLNAGFVIRLSFIWRFLINRSGGVSIALSFQAFQVKWTVQTEVRFCAVT